MNFLLDTNIISEIMRPKPNLLVKNWFIQQELLILSVVSLEEIYYGLLYKDAQKQLEWFERLIYARAKILPITPAIAKRCGMLRARCRGLEITRSQADMLIAATAYQHDLVVATRNIRDFNYCDVQVFNPFDE